MEERCNRLGITCVTYSPGDGIRRYRFVDPSIKLNQPSEPDYFGSSGRAVLGTVLGRKAASLWLDGYEAGLRERMATDLIPSR